MATLLHLMKTWMQKFMQSLRNMLKRGWRCYLQADVNAIIATPAVITQSVC